MHKRGFTLIELSIVLVIIGLIVGGVLVGRDLIAAAMLRKVISQSEQIRTAVTTFEAKYNCEPGDCKNGAALGLVYNGNGNGEFDEYVNTWEHLRLANLINCQCLGSTGTLNVNNDWVIGAGAQYYIALATGTGYFDIFSGTYATHSGDPAGTVYRQRTLALAGSAYNWSGRADASLLPPFTPLQAFRIDTMIDDGTPNSGRLIAGDGRVDPFSTIDWGQSMGAQAGSGGNCLNVAQNTYNSTNNTTRACEVDLTF